MSKSRRSRQHCTPLLIDTLDGVPTPRRLEHVPYRPGEGSSESHDEAWLQTLIQDCPSILPIDEIEPGFGALFPLCTELPTDAGFLDNTFVTANGNIVLAECKLWRNPEARREVVAQIIDYAQAMSSWSYDTLNDSVRKANPEIISIYGVVENHSDLEESQFVDAITRNLKLGRVLLLIVGDGIRSGVEALTQSLQRHAGFHFTLSLIEMPVYRLPTGQFIVQPRILARTENIERGIVSVVDGSITFRDSPEPSSPAVNTRKSISVEQGMEALRTYSTAAAKALEHFLDAASDRGIYLDAGTKTLIIRWNGPDDKTFTLANIHANGDLDTYYVGWTPNTLGRVDLAHEHLSDLAALVGGQVRETKMPNNWHIRGPDGKLPKIEIILNRSNEWLKVIDRYIEKLSSALKEE